MRRATCRRRHRHEAIRIRAADPAAAAAAIWAPPGTLLHSTGHHRSGPPHHHPWGMAATGADGRLDPLEFLLSRFPPQSTLMEEDNDESDASPLQLPWGLRDIDVSIDVELSEVSERGLSERGLSERGLTESGVGSPAEHEDAGSESHVSLGTPPPMPRAVEVANAAGVAAAATAEATPRVSQRRYHLLPAAF